MENPLGVTNVKAWGLGTETGSEKGSAFFIKHCKLLKNRTLMNNVSILAKMLSLGANSVSLYLLGMEDNPCQNK